MLFRSRRDLDVSAVVHDRDVNDTGLADELAATFELWPVDEPGAVIRRLDYVRDGQRALGRYGIFDTPLEHDRVYAWKVQAADSQATSDWSSVCYFRTDFEGPATAPTVTSTDFPADGTLAPL